MPSTKSADTNAKPLASNTPVGGREPSLSLSPKAATAQKFISRAGLASLVLAAIPPADAIPLGAKAIHKVIDVGSPLTVKHILEYAEAAGVARSTLVPKAGIVVERLYSLVPQSPDDFEDATLVYGDGE